MPALLAPAVAGWFGITATTTILGFSGIAIVQTGLGLLGSTILSRATRRGGGAVAQQGISSKFTGQGDTTPQSIIVGRYATAGHQIAPNYSHTGGASASNSPVVGGFGSVGYGKYSTFIISLSDAPVTGLDGVYVDGTYFSTATHLAGAVHGSYGMSVASGVDRAKYVGKLWVKFYDGTQTVVDPYLQAAYGSHPTRPWKATSVLRGAAYLIVTVENDTALYSGSTSIKAVVRGVPLLDPRTGVTGYSDNAAVIQYNVAKGITMPDGRIFGLSGVDLPLDYWQAAMDVCDAQVAKQGGGFEPQYRAGFEIYLATPDDGGMDVLSAIDELLLASSGQVADMGGALITQSGGPATSVLSITDEDILNSRDQSYQPFHGLRDTFNGVSVTYVDPEAKWEAVEAPFYSDAAAVAEDGEQLIASVSLPAVPYADQVQRERIAWLADARRARSHIIALPPRLDRVSVFDVISITSTVHGYINKTFEVTSYKPDYYSGVFQLTIREVDPADFVPDPSKYIGQVFPDAGRFIPTLSLSSFAVAATAGTDGTGAERFPSLSMSWTGEGLDLLRWIAFTVTDGRGNVVASAAELDATKGFYMITGGLIPDQEYTDAAFLAADLPVVNPPAQTVRSRQVLLGLSDLDPSVGGFIQDIAAQSLTAVEFENINIVEIVNQHPAWSGELTVDRSMNNLAPADFGTGPNGWVNVITATPLEVIEHGDPAVVNQFALRVSNTDSAAAATMRNTVNGNPSGRTFRVSFMARVSGSNARPYAQVLGFEGASFRVQASQSAAGTELFQQYSFDLTMPVSASDNVNFRVGFSAATAGGAWIDISDISITDVTPYNSANAVNDGKLLLQAQSPFLRTAPVKIIYTAAAPFDLGEVFLSRLKVQANVVFWDNDYTWADWGPRWSDMTTWAGDTAGSGHRMEVSTTVDDPALPGANWTDWFVPDTLLTNVRGVRSRIVMMFGRANHRAKISFAATVIDMLDRVELFSDVDVPATGLTFMFDPPFRDVPEVAATLVTGSSGHILDRGARTPQSVRFDIKDASGVGVAGKIDITAKGYGRRITL